MVRETLKRQKGFTLVELVVVIVVMSVLTGVAIPGYITLKDRARESGTKSSMRNVATALELYRIEEGGYPASGPGLLAEEGYINIVPEKDLWENEYIYNSGEEDSYTYTSTGVDGEAGTGDDIVFQNGTMIAAGGYLNSGSGGASDIVLLFLSGFSNMDYFIPLMGDWHISEGYLKPSTDNYQNRIVFGDITWSDYEISLDANLKEGDGYGIYYRSNSEEDITGYIFQYDPGLGDKFAVRKVTNGREASPFQRASMPDGFQVYGETHNINISLVGDRHIIKVDDEVVFDFQDDWRGSGMAGFRSWAKSDVDFTELEVKEP
jgi:general secretion pathway protein G